MKSDIRAMLSESEQALLRELEPRKLRKLDEDELVALHQRVRRARNKYAKNYRRGAAAQVGKDRTRAKASATYARTARKAEVFEDALARVSTKLAAAAQASADALKAERLAAARRPTGSAAPKTRRAGSKADLSPGKEKRRTPVGKRASAQARASNKRHQAKRAARKG